MESVTSYLEDYGYVVLLVALMLELILLPIPGQTLMTFAGYLVSQGELNYWLCILFAFIGSSLGMTLSYWIGYKLGAPFFWKHGHRFYLGPNKLNKASKWFNRYGNKMLMIGYFIPGVRHFTGYFAGIIKLPFRFFAIFAYLGALIWTTTFISIGNFLADEWEMLFVLIKKYYYISIIVAVVIVAIYLVRKSKVLRKYVTGRGK